jgi:hypothetical protein
MIIYTGKGPEILTPEGPLITPDLFVMNGNKCFWIEAKHKEAFSWHRITERWVTGIDKKHYEHYCKLDKLSHWKVWLYFLQRGGVAVDSPTANTPTGLYCNSLRDLKDRINHTSDKHGKYGMVYWAESTLMRIAEYEELCLASEP